MPKSAETEDGSESNRLKICIGGNNNNNKLYRLEPMKRSVRPMFSLLLLIFFGATFVSRTFFRRSLLMELNDSVPIQVRTTPQVPVFNETILKLASIDLSEEKTKQEVGQLLDGDMDSIGRYRAFNTWRRFNHKDMRARTSSNRVSLLLQSPNFYRHWLGFRRVLRDWWRNRRYQSQVMSELIRLVKNPIDKHYGFSHANTTSRYASCAVVGNSGILLERDFGELIDSHEVVIRLNNARTEGYEKKVGSKTSISFVNSNILHVCSRREGCFCHPYGESVPIVLYICQALHFLDYMVCNSSHASPLIVTDPGFDVLCARIVKYYSLKLLSEKQGKAVTDWGREHDVVFFHYSSGMQAIMMALGVCEKVSVFGFGKSDSAKHHYHTNQKAELQLHDYEAEYEFYRDLAERPEAVPFIPNSFKIPPVMVYR